MSPPTESDDEVDPERPRLAVVVLSGLFERVHYALVLAAAAAAIGRPVILFFTQHGLLALRAAEQGAPPAWRGLSSVEGEGGGLVDDRFKAAGVASFEDLLEACVEMGVQFLACEMGMRCMGLKPSGLRADVPFEETGAVTFLSHASSGSTVLVI
jgi:peroxiredoxin family protein